MNQSLAKMIASLYWISQFITDFSLVSRSRPAF